MKTRQARKARGRECDADGIPFGFTPIMNETHPQGNHLARRAAKAGWGRSPKAGVGWRRKQWIWGMGHHPRRLDRRCFRITGGRYLAELANGAPLRAQTPRFKDRLLAKLGF
jgi:hypothetical protein